MKKRITVLALSVIVGAGSLYAQGKGTQTESTQMQHPVGMGEGSKGMGGMEPKMMKRMQEQMRDTMIRIVKSELADKMQQKMRADMESAIREKLKKAMEEMQKKAQKMMQSQGMQGKGIGQGRGGMDMGMMGQRGITQKRMQHNGSMQGKQGKIKMH